MTLLKSISDSHPARSIAPRAWQQPPGLPCTAPIQSVFLMSCWHFSSSGHQRQLTAVKSIYTLKSCASRTLARQILMPSAAGCMASPRATIAGGSARFALLSENRIDGRCEYAVLDATAPRSQAHHHVGTKPQRRHPSIVQACRQGQPGQLRQGVQRRQVRDLCMEAWHRRQSPAAIVSRVLHALDCMSSGV